LRNSLKCDRSTAAGGRSQASINNRGLRSPRRCRRGRRRKSSGREMGPSRNGAMTDDSPHPPSPPKRLNGDGALGPVPFFMPGSPTPTTHSCIHPGVSDALAGLYLARTAPGPGNDAPANANAPPRRNATGIPLPRPLWPSLQRSVTETRQRSDRTRRPIPECDARLVGRMISTAVGSRSFAAFGLSVDSNERFDLHTDRTNNDSLRGSRDSHVSPENRGSL
jgi:hypothetical protein